MSSVILMTFLTLKTVTYIGMYNVAGVELDQPKHTHILQLNRNPDVFMVSRFALGWFVIKALSLLRHQCIKYYKYCNCDSFQLCL